MRDEKRKRKKDYWRSKEAMISEVSMMENEALIGLNEDWNQWMITNEESTTSSSGVPEKLMVNKESIMNEEWRLIVNEIMKEEPMMDEVLSINEEALANDK
jgi:hypothetical protein